MKDKGNHFEVESSKPFSRSLIWQLNRDFYQHQGVDAWRNDIVPHHMTSSSMVGKTYAEIILAFLKDLAAKGKTKETVYILELGAGHGRLAFHILKHLQKSEQTLDVEIPPYCYVVSDFVESNLSFFEGHPQFKTYFEKGLMDVSYFDAYESQEIYLRYSKKKISPKDLDQPILAIANYFFDSLPNELFFVQSGLLSNCSVSLHSLKNPSEMNTEQLIENIEISYHKELIEKPFYTKPLLNEMLNDYRSLVSDTYLFFPENAMPG